MNYGMRGRLLGGASFTAMVLLGLAAPALAQQAPNGDVSELEEIVVTGSRIARPAEQSPVPITALGEAELSQRGITAIADAVARIPALRSTRTLAETTDGRATANLRGLGANRTLVLVNGRRHVAGVAGEATVDMSSIPAALVDRVEVLTGGASAVYGADAVTGVVNFILKQDFDGVDARAQVDMPEDDVSRGLRSSASATVGRNFDNGRGNVVLSVSGLRQDELAFGDRKFSRGNRIADDVANPALFIQESDLTPALRAAGVTAGTRILSLSAANQAIAGAALLDRARTAPGRAFVNDPRFALSNINGLIGFDPRGTGFPESATSSRLPALDTDANGTPDCQQSWPGRRGFGCLIVDPGTGRLRPFRDGVFANNDQSGGDGTPDFLDRDSLVPEIEQYNVNLNARYEVSPYFQPFVEGKFARSNSTLTRGVVTFDDSIPIRLDNPFIPTELRNIVNQQIAANPQFANTYQLIITRDHTDVIDNPVEKNDRQTYRVVGGFQGELDNGWGYEVSGNYGRTENDRIRPNRLEDRFFAAIDAVRAPNGQIVCRSSLNPAALPPSSDSSPDITAFNTFNPSDGSCRPINLFSLDAPSPEARAFVSTDNLFRSVIEQRVASVQLTGDSAAFFELPGGPIGFAVGGEYREEESEFTVPEFESRSFTNRGGQQNVTGGYDVVEGFAEVNAPLLADLPGAELLSVDAAYRYGDYSTVGGVDAWKVGGVYAPISDIRARGGYSRTVRAPNINELFAPRSSALFNVVDPCDAGQIGTGPNPTARRANCAADGIPAGFLDPRTARVNGTTGGNINLTEETSTSYTVGAVLRPSFLAGFSATVDYWNIKIKDAIANVPAQDILNACYDAPSLQNSFCSLISRNRTAGSPTFLAVNGLNQSQVNFARFEASGIDFDVVYTVDLEDVGMAEAGAVNLGVTGTWLHRNRNFQSATNASAVDNELSENAIPRWAVNPTVSWEWNALTLSWYGFWQSSQTITGVENETVGNFVQSRLPSSWVHDASVSYAVTENVTVTGGVNNLTDKKPFFGELNRPASSLGRTFFLRGQVSF